MPSLKHGQLGMLPCGASGIRQCNPRLYWDKQNQPVWGLAIGDWDVKPANRRLAITLETQMHFYGLPTIRQLEFTIDQPKNPNF
jgi:hypothetical protein